MGGRLLLWHSWGRAPQAAVLQLCVLGASPGDTGNKHPQAQLPSFRGNLHGTLRQLGREPQGGIPAIGLGSSPALNLPHPSTASPQGQSQVPAPTASAHEEPSYLADHDRQKSLRRLGFLAPQPPSEPSVLKHFFEGRETCTRSKSLSHSRHYSLASRPLYQGGDRLRRMDSDAIPVSKPRPNHTSLWPSLCAASKQSLPLL